MEIEYELNIDDLVAFNLYYYKHSPQIRQRMKTRMILYLGIALFMLALAIYSTIAKSWSSAIIGYVVSVVITGLYYFSTSNIESRVRKELVRRYGEGRNDVIGKHTLSVTQDEIRDITEMAEQKTHWNVIEDIVETEQYLYILFTGSAEAYVIPKKACSDETELLQLKETLVKYQQAAKKSPV